MNQFSNNTNILAHIKKKKLCVFDFDGVLVDSVEIKTNAFYALYKHYGKDIAKKVAEHHIENGGMSRYKKFKKYHFDFLGVEISETELHEMDLAFSDYVVDSVVKANEIPGAEDFLKRISEKQICVVCSATPETEIKNIISLRRWDEYFYSIYGSPNLKSDNLSKALQHFNFLSSETIFFGDAMADFNAALKLNVDFIGVGDTWDSVKSSPIFVGWIKDFTELSW